MAKGAVDEMDTSEEPIISLALLPMTAQGLVIAVIELVCDVVKSSIDYVSDSLFGTNPWTGGPSWLMWAIQHY